MANSKNASAANSAKNESASNGSALNNLAAQAAAYAQAHISASNGSGGAAAKYNLQGFNAYFNEQAKSIGKSQRLKIRRARANALNGLIAAYASGNKAAIESAKSNLAKFAAIYGIGGANEAAILAQLNAGLLSGANGNAANKQAASLALQILAAK